MTENDPLIRKADMHVHTPCSVCYSDVTITAEEIAEGAVAAGLDMMVIVDHNSASGIEGVRKTVGDRLTVFPGVEVTTKNGHFLAIFDTDKRVSEIESFLNYIGIDPSGRGDAHTIADDDTLVTLKKIHECGGLAIAAHIDRWPSGFMESKTTRGNKRKIHESEFLDALEITIPDNRQSWQNGEMRGFSMKRACVQGSDAHHPEDIGRRPVYLRMETISLDGLRKALQNYTADVYFPEDIIYNEAPEEGG